MPRSTPAMDRGDALLVVDVQNDFLPGGALPVPHGNEIVPVLNRYLVRWRARRLAVLASRDWHPPDHGSFRAQGGPWPPHCVAQTPGAAFSPHLELPCDVQIVSKGTAPDVEGYSAFDGTDLEERLRRGGVRRLFVGGLATEYCVLRTVCDALARGHRVVVLRDAIRALDLAAGRRAEQEMSRRGASLAEWTALAA